MVKEKIGVCIGCGAEFVKNHGKQLYCSEVCYNRFHNRKNRHRKITLENHAEIERINREAAEHGMSYGKYVAYLQKKGEME